MQAAEVRNRDDFAAFRRLDLPRHGRVTRQRQVRSRLVIVGEVITQDPDQVRFVEHDRVVQAFATNRADQPLDVRALPGRAVGNDDLFDAQALDTLAEIRALDAIMIADQEARRGVERERLDNLLGCPTRCGTRSYIEVYDPPTVVPHDEKAVAQARSHRRDHEEVDRGDVSDVVFDKCPPRHVRAVATRTGSAARPTAGSAAPHAESAFGFPRQSSVAQAPSATSSASLGDQGCPGSEERTQQSEEQPHRPHRAVSVRVM